MNNNDNVIIIEEMNTRAKAEAQAPVGHITSVEKGSAAVNLGIRAGDRLLSINGHPCQDVIDVQFYGAEDWLEIKIERPQDDQSLKTLTLAGQREEGQLLGLNFEHPTFDIDIRRCNNLCPFCFVLQMGPRFRRTLYIKDDDYRYSFLFGHYVTLTNLSEHDWERIKTQRLSPLYVSVHATDLEIRRQCLGNATAPDITKQLAELAEHHFEVHTQMVVTPGLNDGEHLEKTIRDLGELYPTVASISVVPVGLTKFHKYGHHTIPTNDAQAILETVEKWQAIFREQYGIGLVYCTDEFYLVTERDFPSLEAYDDLDLHENGLGMVRAFLDEWETLQAQEVPTLKTDKRHITLVTGTLAAPVLRQAAQELQQSSGIRVDVLAVENQKLGASITVAGLLMGEDVLNALQDQNNMGDLVILPRIMFDHPDGVSLDDMSPSHIAKTLNKPVALADWMGDVVDALTDNNPLTFAADGSERPQTEDIKQDGGWAVEKYL